MSSDDLPLFLLTVWKPSSVVVPLGPARALLPDVDALPESVVVLEFFLGILKSPASFFDPSGKTEWARAARSSFQPRPMSCLTRAAEDVVKCLAWCPDASGYSGVDPRGYPRWMEPTG